MLTALVMRQANDLTGMASVYPMYAQRQALWLTILGKLERMGG